MDLFLKLCSAFTCHKIGTQGGYLQDNADFLPTDRYQRVFLVYHSAIFRCMWVWFVGAQTFGEKFLAGDLPYFLKSEPIPEKVSHSAPFL